MANLSPYVLKKDFDANIGANNFTAFNFTPIQNICTLVFHLSVIWLWTKQCLWQASDVNYA